MLSVLMSLALADEPAKAPIVFDPIVVPGEVVQPEVEIVVTKLPTHGTPEQERDDAVLRGLEGVAGLK